MKVVILDRAKDDLLAGLEFYERQKPGLGHYFLQCLFEDIDALADQAGIHESEFGYYRSLAKVFSVCNLLPNGSTGGERLRHSRLSD